MWRGTAGTVWTGVPPDEMLSNLRHLADSLHLFPSEAQKNIGRGTGVKSRGRSRYRRKKTRERKGRRRRRTVRCKAGARTPPTSDSSTGKRRRLNPRTVSPVIRKRGLPKGVSYTIGKRGPLRLLRAPGWHSNPITRRRQFLDASERFKKREAAEYGTAVRERAGADRWGVISLAGRKEYRRVYTNNIFKGHERAVELATEAEDALVAQALGRV